MTQGACVSEEVQGLRKQQYTVVLSLLVAGWVRTWFQGLSVFQQWLCSACLEIPLTTQLCYCAFTQGFYCWCANFSLPPGSEGQDCTALGVSAGSESSSLEGCHWPHSAMSQHVQSFLGEGLHHHHPLRCRKFLQGHSGLYVCSHCMVVCHGRVTYSPCPIG